MRDINKDTLDLQLALNTSDQGSNISKTKLKSLEGAQ